MYKKYYKRIGDVVLSVILLMLSLPVFLLIVVILLCTDEHKVFFIQTRPGQNGKLFQLFKFRTMTSKRDMNGNLLSDKNRITRVGNFLRSLSLDEIPQLINVLAGSMSIIGPRPLLPDYLPLYTPEQARRHEVRPGITGWAQVNGRNSLTWTKRFELDVWYVDNLSFSLDLKILLLTVKKVLQREGISSQNAATMERFTGQSSTTSSITESKFI